MINGQLRRLNDAGVRGIRFSLNDPATEVVTPDMIEPLSKHDLGWHIQLNVVSDQIVEFEGRLRRLCATRGRFEWLPGRNGRLCSK